MKYKASSDWELTPSDQKIPKIRTVCVKEGERLNLIIFLERCGVKKKTKLLKTAVMVSLHPDRNPQHYPVPPRSVPGPVCSPATCQQAAT